MRIRTIKPEFWSSEDIAALDYFDRLVFIGLWSMADDEGRLQGDARLIRSQLFPIDDHIGESSVRTHGALTEDSLSIHDTLMHLSNGGQITLYEGCNGRTYIQVTNFTEHQRINRPTASKYPAPTRENTITHGALTEDSSLEQGTGNREQGSPHFVRGCRGVTIATRLASTAHQPPSSLTRRPKRRRPSEAHAYPRAGPQSAHRRTSRPSTTAA